MKLTASPNFVKFFTSNLEQEKLILLEKMYNFFQDLEGRTSEIEVSEGQQTHPSLKNIKLNILIFERHNRWETWSIAFVDTTIPHARIEMWDQSPPKNWYSLSSDYNQLLLRRSLADVSSGFADIRNNPIPILSILHPESWFATSGKITWVYLMLKIKSLPKLQKMFSLEIGSHSPLAEFGQYLIQELKLDDQKLIQVSMHKTSLKHFISQTDDLITNGLNRKHLIQWLNRMDIDFNEWFEG
jgi:hypothetical protein